MTKTSRTSVALTILASILMSVLIFNAYSSSGNTTEEIATEPEHIVFTSNLRPLTGPATAHTASEGSGQITYTDVLQPIVVGVTLEEATRSTARIFASNSLSGEADVPRGSGFLFTHGGEVFFATNAHCIFSDLMPCNFTQLRAVFGYGTDWEFELPLGSVVAYSNSHDLAVLEIDISGAETQLTPIPLGDSDQISSGDEVYTIGHPSDRAERGEEQGANVPIALRVLRRHLFDQSGVESFLLEGEIIPIPGSSGSPVVRRIGDTDRYVAIAVHFAGSGSGSKRGGGNAMPANHLKRDYSHRSGLTIEEADAERRYYINNYTGDIMSMGERYDSATAGIHRAARFEMYPDGSAQLLDSFIFNNNTITPNDFRIIQFPDGALQTVKYSDEATYVLSNTAFDQHGPQYRFFPSSYDDRVIPFLIEADQRSGRFDVHGLGENHVSAGSKSSILTDDWGETVVFVNLKSEHRDGYFFGVYDGFLNFGVYDLGRFTGRWISFEFETSDFYAAESTDAGTLGEWVIICPSEVPYVVHMDDGEGSGTISYDAAGFVIEWSGYGESYSMSTATQHFSNSVGGFIANLTTFRGGAPYVGVSVDRVHVYLNAPNTNYSGIICRAGNWFGIADHNAGRLAKASSNYWYIGQVDVSGSFLASGSGARYYAADGDAAWLYIGQFSSNIPSGQGTRLYSVASDRSFRTVNDGTWDGWEMLEQIWH